MQRGNLLRQWVGLGLILGLLGCSAEPAGSADPSQQAETKVYRWKLITTWPKNLPAWVWRQSGTEHLRKMSNGRLDIKVYGATELLVRLKSLIRCLRARRRWGMVPRTIGGQIAGCCNVCHGTLGMNAQNEWLAASWWRLRTMARAICAF